MRLFTLNPRGIASINQMEIVHRKKKTL